MLLDQHENPFTGTIHFDGSVVNEHHFEGMPFLIDVVDGVPSKKNIRVKERDQEYFNDFNTVKWLEEAWEVFIDTVNDLEDRRDTLFVLDDAVVYSDGGELAV